MQTLRMMFVMLGDIGAAGKLITAPLERRILAILLAKRNHSVSQDYLIDTVWGGQPPARATDSLFSKISRLRHVLGAERIVRTGNGYRLNLCDDECDASRFEIAACKALKSSAQELDDDALAVWQEPVFAEFAHEHFASGERLRLEELRDEVEMHRAELLLSLGSPHATAAADELARRLSLNERVAICRARALAAAGRHVDAVRAMHTFRETLADEIGLIPSAEFVSAEAEILACDSLTTRRSWSTKSAKGPTSRETASQVPRGECESNAAVGTPLDRAAGACRSRARGDAGHRCEQRNARWQWYGGSSTDRTCYCRRNLRR